MQGLQVPSLVRELRSHVPHGVAKKRKKKIISSTSTKKHLSLLLCYFKSVIEKKKKKQDLSHCIFPLQITLWWMTYIFFIPSVIN